MLIAQKNPAMQNPELNCFGHQEALKTSFRHGLQRSTGTAQQNTESRRICKENE